MRIQRPIVALIILIPVFVSARPLSTYEQRIVGEWHSEPNPAIYYGEVYIFSPRGEFVKVTSDLDRTNRVLSKSGTWQAKKGEIELIYKHQIVRVGGELKTDPEIGNFLEGGKQVREAIDDTDFVSLEYIDKKHILINKKRFWNIKTQGERDFKYLFDYAQTNTLRDAEILFILGADANSSMITGWSLLHQACKSNSLEFVKLLFEKGAGPNVSDEVGETPLSLAVANKNIKVVDYLIKNGAFVNVHTEPEGSFITPLHIAIKNNDFEMVKLLMQSGASWKMKTGRGETALDLARESGNAKIEKLILTYSRRPPSKLRVEGNYVQIVDSKKIRTIGNLASSDAFPFGFSKIYKFSPDSLYIAFVESTEKGYDLFLVSNTGERGRSTWDGKIDSRTTIAWDRKGKAFLFNENGRIIFVSTEGYRQKTLTNPEEGYEDILPSFKERGKVKFFRGTRFEYSFSGSEYEVSITGTHCRRIPKGEVIQPEHLGGEE